MSEKNKYPRLDKVIGAMAEQKITQEQMALLLTAQGYKMSKQSLNAKLNGKAKIYYDEMVLFARVLNREPASIFF